MGGNEKDTGKGQDGWCGLAPCPPCCRLSEDGVLSGFLNDRIPFFYGVRYLT